MELLYLVGCILWILAAWKWGDWCHFNRYNSSIFLIMSGNLLYAFLTFNHSLWEYESPSFHWKHTFFVLLVVFICIPCAILIYLSKYPKTGGLIKQIGYLLLWALTFTLHEWIVCQAKIFSYHNGWTLGWSTAINVLMFAFARLNQRKPIITYLLFLAISAAFFFYFEVPIEKLK